MPRSAPGIWPIILALLTAWPGSARAVLLDDGPERILFQGVQEGLWVRVLRRRTSYAIHAYRLGGTRRVLARGSWVGLIEGSTTGLMLDPRAIAIVRRRCPPDRPLRSLQVEGMHRYRIDDGEWMMAFTSKSPFTPTLAHRVPERIASQFLARAELASQVERLSRGIDPVRLVWRRDSAEPRPAIGLPILTPARPAGLDEPMVSPGSEDDGGLEGEILVDPSQPLGGEAPAPPPVPRVPR